MVHAKVNAVLLFCFIDKKIFQNVLPICWGERFFADAATNQPVQSSKLSLIGPQRGPNKRGIVDM
jgi:hypothetical protein